MEVILELANKDKEERYQNNTYGNGNDHSEEYTGTDRVTAGRTRSRSQNPPAMIKDHSQNPGVLLISLIQPNIDLAENNVLLAGLGLENDRTQRRRER